MDERTINFLLQKLVGNYRYIPDNFEQNLMSFVKLDIDEKLKEDVLEEVYILGLFSNAYVGPNPVVRLNFINEALSVLEKNTEEEIKNGFERLKKITEYMKTIEMHPLDSIKRKVEDIDKYKGVKF